MWQPLEDFKNIRLFIIKIPNYYHEITAEVKF